MNDEWKVRIEATAALLLQTAREAHMTLSGDLRVSEQDAAALLAYAPGYLKALRAEGKGPTPYGRGMNGSRVSYRISDLAGWVEAAREGW